MGLRPIEINLLKLGVPLGRSSNESAARIIQKYEDSCVGGSGKKQERARAGFR